MKTESLRNAYGKALVEIGEENKNIVVLEADLGKSTMSAMFQKVFPERYFEMGIGEQNMASVAAGLSLTGKIPFINSFAVFVAGRAYDQIRQTISIANLNVKIDGSSGGLSDYGDGSTHQSIEDIALMRVIPTMTVLVPADAVETRKMVKAMAEYNGPVYIRINRNELPIITNETSPYEIGKLYTVREGKDVVIFANGVMVFKAMEAAEKLSKRGISAQVVNVSTVKPLDSVGVIEIARKVKGVITAEEHSIVGGLGSAIAEVLRATKVPIDFVGIEDKYGTSARNYEELLNYYNLTSEAIVNRAEKILKNI